MSDIYDDEDLDGLEESYEDDLEDDDDGDELEDLDDLKPRPDMAVDTRDQAEFIDGIGNAPGMYDPYPEAEPGAESQADSGQSDQAESDLGSLYPSMSDLPDRRS